MIGMNLKVEMADGTSHVVPVTYKVACAWEDHHPQLSWQRFLEDLRFKPLAYLAWEACRAAGVPTKPFGGFLDNLGEVSIVPKEQPQE